ncbi:ABC transporter ATP-binding protein [Rhizobium sp. CF142]|uniref:ABC transporter ATP-binding protein n=1 Tax=Rhizobium sp. CF142 TaxID=1144314 RepID=UPI00026EEAE5|nr:ABC transporter ATP-binding protein [Rhizobium sp. CF142]EJJ31485.1 ABC-type branched-chain amino acid transport system, ATPase component [Rhizobium sp. CF142]
MSVLSVKGLCKSFNGHRAVQEVDLTVEKGKMVALIGPNGAGKTTCFNLLNGQLAADAGSVELEGQSIIGLHPREIWRIGVGRTFQITQTFASMTVLENIQVALMSQNGRLWNMIGRAGQMYEAEAMTLLELVGMATQARRGCGVLAYGDLKKVELAVAMANQPKLLLMDEPTAGMAPKERIDLMGLTATVAKQRNISVLFTEHDMDIVFSRADEIVVLDRGRVIARGTPGEVRNNENVREIYLGSGNMYT